MSQQQLHNNWQFQTPDGTQWLSATIPGCIHTDLRRHELIPDPFYGRNEFDLQWIEEKDWNYRLNFTPDSALLEQPFIDLVCEGLDTVASVKLNGEVILRSENMFHRHRLPVKEKLLAGENTLEIEFASALEYIRQNRNGFETREFNDPVGGSTVIRKQQNQFGWDWGPRFVTCGIWRPVYLEGWSENRIESVHIAQHHSTETVSLCLSVEAAQPATNNQFRATVSLSGEVVATALSDAPQLKCEIHNPQLWWPSGQGEQPLYDVQVELLRGEEVTASWQRRIGLRTIELDMGPDEHETKDKEGVTLNRFGLRINGRLVFAKGANWIPAHSFVAGLTREDYEPLLASAHEANMNIIRLWGGGIYEHEAFYDLCDEMGLLVWQDFMFACTLAPAGDEFLQSIRREALDQIKRVRHHACIALWCGNNELVALNKDILENDERRRDEYVCIFLKTLPDALNEANPGATYIHSSPLHTIPALPETQMPSHDEHDWSVWHQMAPVEYYETTRHRFNSEFGMQSYPSPRMTETFCPPEELNILSPTFEAHQKHSGGNSIIFNYAAQLFRFPKDYRSISYLSQLNQAYCMKMAIEHFRRCQPQCLGAMYWQLNDCWPVASWSSIEFDGVWKAIHHYARRFFAPAMVSIKLLGGDTAGIGNRRTNTKNAVEIWTSYDNPHGRNVHLLWELATLSGETISSGDQKITLNYGESVLRLQEDFSQRLQRVGKTNVFLRALLKDEVSGEILSRSTALFTAPRFLELGRESVEVTGRTDEAGEWELTLTSSTFHYGVSLEETPGVRYSDNYFELWPGVPHIVTTNTAAKELPKVFSVVDTY